jgi:hypothetical protein
MRALWSGRLPVAEAFWNYAVFWGVLINVAAFLVTLALLAMLKQYDHATLAGTLLTAAALVVHVAPIPYNLVALVGVWRSAARCPAATAALFRCAAVVLLTFLSIVS